MFLPAPALPARAYTPAMIGDEALVPPTTNQPDWFWNGVESKTATPVLGSATAETSATARRRQPVLAFAWPEIWAWKREQPLPAPLHTVSLQPRLLEAVVSVVPPTAVTNFDEAG